MNDLPVLILSLGGTIAMMPGAEPGVVPKLTAEALVAAVPGLDHIARIEAQSFRLLPSAHLSLDDLDALAALITVRAPSICGVVITQGTDTIEETAFALDRILAVDIPVIVTGAMRNPSLPGADGPANLMASVQVASDPAFRGMGVLVVMNDEIHTARWVGKRHSSNVAAFISADAGPIGWLAEGRALIALHPRKPVGLPLARPVSQPAKVALLTLGVDDHGEMVDAAITAGFDGIVVAAAGGGHATPKAAEALARAAQHIPVILTSRTGAGATLRATYGYVGAEIPMLASGLIHGAGFTPLKARILLLLCLRRGLGRAEIVAQFQQDQFPG